MANGADYEPVRVNADEPIDRLAGKLALEVSSATLVGSGCCHFFCQIFQNVMGIPVEPIDDIREV
jgi:hypothetical protein